MRYHELNENIVVPFLQMNEDNIREAAEIIKRDCQPFLSQCGGKLFYRGINIDEDRMGFINKRTVRENRWPKNTRRDIHDILVRTFDEIGFKANRNNSIFGNGNPTLAAFYGFPYTVFPIGDFSYTWSEHIVDLTEFLNGEEMGIDWIYNDVFQVTDIQDDSEHEIEILRELSFDYLFNQLEKYNPDYELHFDAKEFRAYIWEIYTDSKELPLALNIGHEIAIRPDGGEYYYVPIGKYPITDSHSKKFLKILGMENATS